VAGNRPAAGDLEHLGDLDLEHLGDLDLEHGGGNPSGSGR